MRPRRGETQGAKVTTMESGSWRESAAKAGRVLTFTASRDDLAGFTRTDLRLGIVLTWLVGIGRHWDNPRVEFIQKTGVGSVVYIFVLAALLFVFAAPFMRRGRSYRNVLAFVSLTSPPGFLYAIPVEKFMTISEAATTNAYFLALVAAWRVALFLYFLVRGCGITVVTAVVATLLPLTAVVTALTVLNLDRAVFDIMRGVGTRSSHDVAYEVLIIITAIAWLALPGVAVAYLILLYFNHKRITKER